MTPYRGRRDDAERARGGLCGAIALASAGPATAGDDGGTVVIYSGRTENLVKPILDRFSEETGIDVEVRYGNTSDLALLIEEEGDQAPADVFLSQSPGAVGYLDQRGLLGTLAEDVVDLVPEQFHAGDGSWVGVSGRQRVLAFNPQIVPEEELPSSVLDLTGRGVVGAHRHRPVERLVPGLRLGDAHRARRRGDERVAGRASPPTTRSRSPTTAAIVAAIGRGEIDVGLVNHYYVYQALAEDPDFPGRNHNFAADDIGSLVIVTAASVLAGADHSDEADELVEFLLSEEAQRYFSDETFEYPLASGVEPADVLPDVDLAAASDVELDFDDLGADLEIDAGDDP